MRIAIISTMRGYSWAGTEEVWYHFAKLAMEEGHEIMLGADEKVVASDQVKELVKLGLKTASRRLFKPMRLFLLKQRIRPDMAPVEAFSPDVILVNAGSPLDHVFSPYIWDFCRELNAPKVFFCHFNSDRLRIPDRAALKETFLEMSGMVFVSKDNKRVLERQLATLFPSAQVIVNGPRLKMDKPLAWPDSPIRFAQVARLETEWKGHDILLETLAGDIWRERNWELTIFGTGPDEQYIRELVTMYELSKKVKFGGYVRDMREVYGSHHLLLLPSRGEGTPLAALEAMMCGRPVVATDVGGNSEIIDEGISGFIADAPTASSFGKALDRAWGLQNDWQLLGARAHERALQLEAADPPRKLLDYLVTIR
ncbi:glycosyltransferase family 4 protein [Puniceicoccales bacterium CK1056]|uniref:Glycosyltransferase family 4 protein n=1 Tax=Oceanipulchritudo coccoides TaxID=2706888 RepID=A0A6B2M0S7_9BACT|nr:glycosyltransferase family 4 protein [Oceanipulchritudo coccoides]NDV62323.1 glycosyltransferase family 4 protein [Oceanipulchritudo coccoides]